MQVTVHIYTIEAAKYSAVIFVDTNPPKDRIAVLKSPDDLSKLHGEDTNVFQRAYTYPIE